MAVALKENRAVRGIEAAAERPDGSRVPFIPYPTPLHDEAGRLVGAVNMLVDITERKRAEEQQALLVRELHHRVKNTLATVQASAQPDGLHSFYARVQENYGARPLERRCCPNCDPGSTTRRFPTITALCREAGIDPVTQPIPIRPAVHYHMGGIAVDRNGRTSVDGLWACGEAACTGLHGANRLASNSLLEAAVCGGWVARDIAATMAERRRQPLLPGAGIDSDPTAVRPILSRAAGVLRDREGLGAAARALYPLAASREAASDPAIVGLMIVIAALRRQESRGAHARTDFPKHANSARRSTLRLDDALAAARELVPDPVV